MLKKPLFLEMIGLLFLVGFLDRIANFYNLYWSTSEFDSVVHFFGGATVSMFFLWLYFFSGKFNPTERTFKKFLVISFLGSVFIAMSWEIYELLLGEAQIQKMNYGYDTTL